MTALPPVSDTVGAREEAIRRLNPTVRRELSAAARTWGLPPQRGIHLTSYDQVYPRMPEVGGHWTLFHARAGTTQHEITVVSVSVLFEGERPTDFVVSGVVDALAGGCSALALREALAECRGPLRQVTPLPRAGEPDPVLAIPRVFGDVLLGTPALN